MEATYARSVSRGLMKMSFLEDGRKTFFSSREIEREVSVGDACVFTCLTLCSAKAGRS